MRIKKKTEAWSFQLVKDRYTCSSDGYNFPLPSSIILSEIITFQKSKIPNKTFYL